VWKEEEREINTLMAASGKGVTMQGKHVGKSEKKRETVLMNFFGIPAVREGRKKEGVGKRRREEGKKKKK